MADEDEIKKPKKSDTARQHLTKEMVISNQFKLLSRVLICNYKVIIFI